MHLRWIFKAYVWDFPLFFPSESFVLHCVVQKGKRKALLHGKQWGGELGAVVLGLPPSCFQSRPNSCRVSELPVSAAVAGSICSCIWPMRGAGAIPGSLALAYGSMHVRREGKMPERLFLGDWIPILICAQQFGRSSACSSEAVIRKEKAALSGIEPHRAWQRFSVISPVR